MRQLLRPFFPAILFCAVLVAGRSEETLKNHNFGQDLAAWKWTGGGSGSVLSQAALDGSNVFQVLPVTPLAPLPWELQQSVAGLTPGTVYRLIVWTHADQNGPGRLIAGPKSVALPAGSHDWTPTQLDFTAPADGKPIDIGVILDTASKRLWLSGFSLTPVLDRSEEIARLQLQNRPRLARIETRLDGQPAALRTDAYLRMGLAIAHRYLERVDASGPGGTQGLRGIDRDDPEIARWNLLQARETATVLTRIESRLDALASGRLSPWSQPTLDGTRLEVRADGFTSASPDGTARPVVLGGYGHFDPVMEDTAFLGELGVNLVQQERGPRDLRPARNLSTHAQILVRQLGAPAPGGRKIDLLLSPHYMPVTLSPSHPDLAGNQGGGFIKYNIDHPVARQTISDWIATIVPRAAGQPNLFAFCLSNEADYSGSGRDSFSRPLWTAWLEARHENITRLNSRYGSAHTSFAAVPVPPTAFPADSAALPAYYDWVVFNQEHFADWHRWMNDQVKTLAPDAWTHAKLMPDVFDTRPRTKRTHTGILSRGVDPELITRFTDLGGCDSWSFLTPDQEWSYTWVRTHVWYDLLNSFNRRPVFDSELHAIVDRHPAESIDSGHIYTTLWQGALHHRTAFTTWLWQEPSGNSAQGSIYLRPDNIYAASQALLDLNRLAPEIAAINAAPARVALLYSPTSLFWQEDYPSTLKDLYTLLTVLGHKITFVSERQLATGDVSTDIRCLFLPRATHVQDTTRAALQTLIQSGVSVLPIGRENLAFTPYNQPATVPPLPKAKRIGPNRNADLDYLSTLLREKLGPALAPAPLLSAETGDPAWGVEYRDLTVDGRRLIPLTNLRRETIRVKFAGGGLAEDLISGQSIDLSDFYLRPSQPLLLASPVTP